MVQLRTKSDDELAHEIDFWSRDCQVDAIWKTRRHHMSARRLSAQRGSKSSHKGLLDESWGPPGSLLGAFGRLLKGIWRLF